jgi:DNA polymerase elongation subunit (family B)
LNNPKIKRLFFDIETSPNIGFFWEAGWKKTIGYENIIKERSVICIGYKWEHEKEVHCISWDTKQNDKKMLESFIKIANQADELVAHNGDRFDLPWIRTRCLKHDIPMFPTYTTIDTLKVSRNKFRFNSNRLDYISKFLGVGEKISTEYGLWVETVLNNDKVALAKMIKYCKNDVLILEKVYNKLAPYVQKTHVGVLNGNGKSSCPHCGSNRFHLKAKTVSAAGNVKQRLHCQDCFRWYQVPITAIK